MTIYCQVLCEHGTITKNQFLLHHQWTLICGQILSQNSIASTFRSLEFLSSHLFHISQLEGYIRLVEWLNLQTFPILWRSLIYSFGKIMAMGLSHFDNYASFFFSLSLLIGPFFHFISWIGSSVIIVAVYFFLREDH